MRVAIVGGRTRVDCLMGALAEASCEVVAVNDDRRFCEYLSSRHDGTVIWGDGTKLSVLEEAGIEGFDAIVALTGYDPDNLVVCQVAKEFLAIDTQLCVVSNPENTLIFRQLGVTAAIGATAALAEAIREALGLSKLEVAGSAPNTTVAGANPAEAASGGAAPDDRGTDGGEEGAGGESRSLRSLLGSWHRIGKDGS